LYLSVWKIVGAFFDILQPLMKPLKKLDRGKLVTTDNYNSFTSSHILLFIVVLNESSQSSLGTALQWLLNFFVQRLLSLLACGSQLCRLLSFQSPWLQSSLAVTCLTTQLDIAWLQSSSSGYSSCPYSSRIALPNHWLKTDSLKVVLRPMVSQFFWCQAPSGVQDQIFVTLRQLQVCWYGHCLW
jgi:hypothetical protein